MKIQHGAAVGVYNMGHDVGGDKAKVMLRVDVFDKHVRNEIRDFDGLEKPFALVPRMNGSKVEWDRVALSYERTNPARTIVQDAKQQIYTLPEADVHTLIINDVDYAAVKQYGVAFGMETSKQGTLWFQEEGQDFRLSTGGSPDSCMVDISTREKIY